jgi:thiol-disulfide isomerase/thioredoxin
MLNYPVKVLTLLVALLVSSQAYSKPPIFVDKAEDAFALSEDIKVDVLLVYTATWCGSCIVMKNDLHNNLDLIENTIVCYVDYDDNLNMAKQYGVKTLPTYFLYVDKKEKKRGVGYRGIKKFKEWLKNDQ